MLSSCSDFSKASEKYCFLNFVEKSGSKQHGHRGLAKYLGNLTLCLKEARSGFMAVFVTDR